MLNHLHAIFGTYLRIVDLCHVYISPFANKNIWSTAWNSIWCQGWKAVYLTDCPWIQESKQDELLNNCRYLSYAARWQGYSHLAVIFLDPAQNNYQKRNECMFVWFQKSDKQLTIENGRQEWYMLWLQFTRMNLAHFSKVWHTHYTDNIDWFQLHWGNSYCSSITPSNLTTQLPILRYYNNSM